MIPEMALQGRNNSHAVDAVTMAGKNIGPSVDPAIMPGGVAGIGHPKR